MNCLRKILIANRGEIAVRLVRACRDLGIRSVAVHSACDASARHVRMADEAVAIGGDAPGDSYLRIDRLIAAARVSGADAVHPGYGFLAENPAFAAACLDAGLVFIGPTPEAMALLGRKTTARQVAQEAGVPVVPGDSTVPPDADEPTLAARAAAVGYPLVVKAVAGGGGRGMRLVPGPDDLGAAVRAARSEAGASFGEASLYVERYLGGARHVEIQVLADHHGTVLPFVERECSVQRRYQKVLEESPSPAVTPELRDRLVRAAVSLAAAAGYRNAGTVEFLLDGTGAFHFLEMNTRLQVEHPVTELVTGVDLVCWQIRVARGERLTLDPASLLVPRGHAIECRITAEDPDAGFSCPRPADHRAACARRPRHPGGQRRRDRQRRAPLLRPARGEAHRLGRGPAAGRGPPAPGARRVRDHGNQDERPLFPLAAEGTGVSRGHSTHRLAGCSLAE
jgi:acetyl/propionyl-CoA carboxylase alpha subunit